MLSIWVPCPPWSQTTCRQQYQMSMQVNGVSPTCTDIYLFPVHRLNSPSSAHPPCCRVCLSEPLPVRTLGCAAHLSSWASSQLCAFWPCRGKASAPPPEVPTPHTMSHDAVFPCANQNSAGLRGPSSFQTPAGLLASLTCRLFWPPHVPLMARNWQCC